MQLTLNVTALIEEYGGPSRMARYCAERGFKISKQGISRWERDGIVPMRAWLALYAIELQEGKKLDLRRYINTGGKA